MYNNESFSSQQQIDIQAGCNSFVARVFGTMFLGLLVTAIAALYTATSEPLLRFLFSGVGVFAFIIAELAIVIVLSARITKLKKTTATIMFYLYAVINGITLASIFFAYELGTIYTAFFTAAISFGVMAIYGAVTKKDLTKIGNMLFMLLIGVVVASLINLFMRSETFDLIISFVAVAVFVGLVAFDTQKLKGYYYSTIDDYQMQRKIGILGALSLYLDFINIFLYLLRIFGSRRD